MAVYSAIASILGKLASMAKGAGATAAKTAASKGAKAVVVKGAKTAAVKGTKTAAVKAAATNIAKKAVKTGIGSIAGSRPGGIGQPGVGGGTSVYKLPPSQLGNMIEQMNPKEYQTFLASAPDEFKNEYPEFPY